MIDVPSARNHGFVANHLPPHTMHWFTIYLTNGRMPQMIKMSSSSKLIFPCPSPKASVHQSSAMHRASFAWFTVACTKNTNISLQAIFKTGVYPYSFLLRSCERPVADSNCVKKKRSGYITVCNTVSSTYFSETSL